MWRISISQMLTYMKCPRMWYFQYRTDVPKHTDYPRLCGITTHSIIQRLHQRVPQGRKFFYKERSSALGAWRGAFAENLRHAEGLGQVVRNPAEEGKYWGIGQQCLGNYWDQEIEAPTEPIAVERRFASRISSYIQLVGFPDQIRPVSYEYIAKKRPDLLASGDLDPKYAPVVIVDLKTSYFSYDASVFASHPELLEGVRRQYELHEDLQATAYTWLYERVFGVRPIGFLWYHLRSGKMFFTYRTERDYITLANFIAHFIDNVMAQSFPKFPSACRHCDHIVPCREDDDLLISNPEVISEMGEALKFLKTDVVKDSVKQLRLRLKTPRMKRLESIPKRRKERITLRDLPWDDPLESDLNF